MRNRQPPSWCAIVVPVPYTVQLERAPAGFCATAMLPGASGLIEICGFHTSDEGLAFTRMLEGCEVYLTGAPETNRSQIDHLLAVIAPDRKVMVYVNELRFIAKAQVKRGAQAGEPVMLDDVADITAIDVDVEIPPDCGLVFLFSWRWRKALFFDLRPLGPRPVARDYNLPATLAACHCALVFPERFSINDAQWERMISQGWFPFAGLKNSTINEIILHCQQGWNLARLQPGIIEECKQLAPEFSVSCQAADIFKPHAEAIRLAAGHFVAGDNISSAHLLYPRIEGILRGYYLAAGAANKPTQERFLAAALSGAMAGRHGYCLLLLERFDTYLRTVTFGTFDPANPTGVSRHTIGHGVVDLDQCDEKSVALAFLSLHHLYYSLRPLEAKPRL
jgi:hypothetical protein